MCELTEQELSEIPDLDADLEERLEWAEAGAENETGSDDSEHEDEEL
jgi:hypothetical protein